MTSSKLYWLIGAVVAILAVLVLWLAIGTLLVTDRTGNVAGVAIVNKRQEQPLTQLWDGVFFAMPKIEGVIEVRCADGSRKQFGYVTGHMHTRSTVESNIACAGE